MADDKQKSSIKKSILPALLFWLLITLIVALGTWFYITKNSKQEPESTSPSITVPTQEGTTPPPVTIPANKKTTTATPAPVTIPANKKTTTETPAPVTIPPESSK